MTRSELSWLLMGGVILVIGVFVMFPKNRGLFETWVSGYTDDTSQFIQNNVTASNVQQLAPSETDATTSQPNIDGKYAAASDPMIDSRTILPAGIMGGGGGGDVGGTEIKLLGPKDIIGESTPRTKIPFLQGGDIRNVPCVDKLSQDKVMWGWSSIQPTDILFRGCDIGQSYSCG